MSKKLFNESAYDQLLYRIDWIEKRANVAWQMIEGGRSAFTMAETCRILRVSMPTLKKYVKEGHLAFQWLGLEYCISSFELKHFLINRDRLCKRTRRVKK